MNLHEIEQRIADVTHAVTKMNEGIAYLRQGLAEADEELRRLEGLKRALPDEALAGDYVVTHGSHGSTPKGGIVRLGGDEARRLLAERVVKPHLAAAQDELEPVHETEAFASSPKEGESATADGVTREHALDGDNGGTFSPIAPLILKEMGPEDTVTKTGAMVAEMGQVLTGVTVAPKP